MALSEIGLKNYEKASQCLNSILKLQPDHQGALQHKKMIQKLHKDT